MEGTHITAKSDLHLLPKNVHHFLKWCVPTVPLHVGTGYEQFRRGYQISASLRWCLGYKDETWKKMDRVRWNFKFSSSFFHVSFPSVSLAMSRLNYLVWVQAPSSSAQPAAPLLKYIMKLKRMKQYNGPSSFSPEHLTPESNWSHCKGIYECMPKTQVGKDLINRFFLAYLFDLL